MRKEKSVCIWHAVISPHQLDFYLKEDEFISLIRSHIFMCYFSPLLAFPQYSRIFRIVFSSCH